MKKLLAVILSICLLLAFASCTADGGSENGSSQNESSQNESSQNESSQNESSVPEKTEEQRIREDAEKLVADMDKWVNDIIDLYDRAMLDPENTELQNQAITLISKSGDFTSRSGVIAIEAQKLSDGGVAISNYLTVEMAKLQTKLNNYMAQFEL